MFYAWLKNMCDMNEISAYTKGILYLAEDTTLYSNLKYILYKYNPEDHKIIIYKQQNHI